MPELLGRQVHGADMPLSVMEAVEKAFSAPVRHVALLGSYLPRQCGIATFTKDLRDALCGEMGSGKAFVLAMDEANLTYPSDVRFQVRTHLPGDYRTAADILNINQVDVTIVQHEFGIYGGPDGSLLLNFMRHLRMPMLTTLHTVIKEPSRRQLKIVQEMGELSDRLIVMSHLGATFLQEIYGIPPEKIEFIPHGIPDVPFVDPSFYKDQFGLEGRTVLLTFGLLGPGKGIELMLNALPKIVEHHPKVMYVILGATHPNILKEQGDAYRSSLELLVKQHGMREHVMFQNRFVTLDELCGYIGAADLYVTPYPNPNQITSGTLAYAMGAGKAVVSTPYWYAEEMLAENRGKFFPFNDFDALAKSVNHMLDHETERNHIRKDAYMHCRPMVWKEVARQYLSAARQAVEDRRHIPRLVGLEDRAEVVPNESLPAISLDHLRTMTDDTGIYQHAIYTIPDRNHGYCTDDNARALIVALRYYDLCKDDAIFPLTDTYMAFLHSAFNHDEGRFRNFLSYSRRWLEKKGSPDSHARALWALGEAVALSPNEGVLNYATRLFNEALPAVEDFRYPRSLSFVLVGIHAYLQRFGGDVHIRRLREKLAKRLFAQFEKNASTEWPWCEKKVTYSNGKMPHALILCGQWIPDGKMLEMGLRSLEWLLEIQTNEQGQLSLIGCEGWFTQGEKRALFDQQPVEVAGLIEACAEAYRATGDPKWGKEVRRCLDWFLGSNDIGALLYDFKTGGSRDGLNPQGANQNEGAESTLAWLLSLICAYELTDLQEGRREEKQEP